MVREAPAPTSVLPDYAALGHGGTAVKKMARAMTTPRVAKIVVKGTEPKARLLYRLMSMMGGQPVPPIEAWTTLRVEPL